jgi:hypothetical protein
MFLEHRQATFSLSSSNFCKTTRYAHTYEHETHLVALKMNHTRTHTCTHMQNAVGTFCVDAKMQHKHIRTHTRTHTHAKCGGHLFCVMPTSSTEAYTHAQRCGRHLVRDAEMHHTQTHTHAYRCGRNLLRVAVMLHTHTHTNAVVTLSWC